MNAPRFFANHAASRGSPRVPHRCTRDFDSEKPSVSATAESEANAVSPVISSLPRLCTRVTRTAQGSPPPVGPANTSDTASTASGCTQTSAETPRSIDITCAGAMGTPPLPTMTASNAPSSTFTPRAPPSTHRASTASRDAVSSGPRAASRRRHALYDPSCTAHASRVHFVVDRYPRPRPGRRSGTANPHRVRISNRLACHTCVSSRLMWWAPRREVSIVCSCVSQRSSMCASASSSSSESVLD